MSQGNSSPVPSLSNFFTTPDEFDESAFFKAVMSMASQLGQKPESDQSHVSTESSSRTVKAESFVSETVSRFEEFQNKKLAKIERMRQERESQELANVQDRPTINPISHKILRIEAELRRKSDRLRKLEIQLEQQRLRKEETECTFTPKILKPQQRSTLDFAKRSQAWLEKRNLSQAHNQEEKLQEELNSCRKKPEINEKSERLARGEEGRYQSLSRCSRSHTPEVQRFRPELSPNSRRLAKASRPLTPVHIHLYSLSVSRVAPSPPRSVKAETRPLPKLPEHLPYSVNSTPRVVYDTPVPVTDLSFDDSMKFLLANFRAK